MTDHIDTRLAHAGAAEFYRAEAPVNVPVVRTSTVRFADVEAYEAAHARRLAGENVATYGRHGLDTHRALEQAILTLEGGRRCVLAPSGLAAISLTFLALLSPGDHVVVSDSVYAPVRKLHRQMLDRLGIDVSYFAAQRDDIEAMIRPNTRLLYVESPGSLLFEVLDLPRLAAIARSHGLLLAADNTWASGYLQQPLALGADVSVLASTKYLCGHSDVMQGAVVAGNEAVAERIVQASDALGTAVGADDAYLTLRGMRTLAVRLAQHQRNALSVAEFLQGHAEVAQVFYPALASDPGHALWQRDFSGANGLLSFEFHRFDLARAHAFVNALRLFGIGASWGGYESLALLAPPERITAQHAWRGSRPVVRLHIGLESAADLVQDLQQAFRHACEN
ncbi:cystathionine beta-lyase [Noviherbaspirillum sp. L7-7A]|uniref:cystathionine beta-lyase n=1 Tax=Noviherbaspirillum sp. L7-7A TaxID=2850560 RepID=UPI001C2C6AA1|nr:cystathionine beta-lyase [Noviherbaspirillum sp. L7-7A]MBV0882143.1 cystathionine beta-lyase [Noviherbaspirillum sp. L7-7A]